MLDHSTYTEMVMDNYPEELAPEMDEGGGVVTPFEEWWPRVRHHFRHVPEEVGRDWLHRHWGYSPYHWIASADYRFQRVTLPVEDMPDVLSSWNNFSRDRADLIKQGRFLVEDHRVHFGYKLANYMLEKGDYPVPVVILDNRDSHLVQWVKYPAGLILIEGHRRFNIACYLASIGKFAATSDYWLMTKHQEQERPPSGSP